MNTRGGHSGKGGGTPRCLPAWIRAGRAACWAGGAAAALLALAGCRAQPQRPEPPEPPRPERPFAPKMQARGITWVLPDPLGRPIWEMRASRGSGVAAQGLAQLEEVRCRVWSDGKPALDARAARVQANYPARRLELVGGVSARTIDGKRSFQCERVVLSVKEEKRAVVEASGSVRLEVDGVVMSGERVVTNPRLSSGQVLAR